MLVCIIFSLRLPWRTKASTMFEQTTEVIKVKLQTADPLLKTQEENE